MQTSARRARRYPLRATFAALVGLAVMAPLPMSAPALADPSDWAPAYGYRDKHEYKHKKKHKKKHKREHGEHHDYRAARVPVAIELGRCNRELVGSIIGAAGGAFIGSQIGKGDGRLAAVAGGTLLGLIIGGSIGRSMDRIDEHCFAQSLEHARDGQAVVWKNPDAGSRYNVTPVRTYTGRNGLYCREYETIVTIDGRREIARGAACRQPDGRWERAG